MSIEAKVLKWIFEGNTGLSSMCMAAHLTGHHHLNNHPMEPADFDRCVGLLEAVPELRPLLPKMAERGKIWADLVQNWGRLGAIEDKYVKFKAIQKIRHG